MSSPYSTGFFDERLEDPGPLTFKPVSGSRLLVLQSAAKLDEIAAHEEHEKQMGDAAARAVRFFASSALEVQWHTLKFEIVSYGRSDEAGLQIWRWTVWAS